MKRNLLTVAAAVLPIFLASAALAGPNDGIRPGPSPAPWLLPAGPKDTQPYALTGNAGLRNLTPAGDWRLEHQRVGNKVDRDVFVR